MMMKRLVKAVFCGVITEIVACILSVTLLSVGHFGACGPTDMPSYVGFYIQFPGVLIMEQFLWNSSNAMQLFSIVVTQTILWTLIWFSALTFVAAKK